MFSSVSHPGTLQKLVTKYQATEVIQESLLHANVIGQQEVKKFVQDRWIVAVSVSVSVSARYCIPQCVRLIAGGGMSG